MYVCLHVFSFSLPGSPAELVNIVPIGYKWEWMEKGLVWPWEGEAIQAAHLCFPCGLCEKVFHHRWPVFALLPGPPDCHWWLHFPCPGWNSYLRWDRNQAHSLCSSHTGLQVLLSQSLEQALLSAQDVLHIAPLSPWKFLPLLQLAAQILLLGRLFVPEDYLSPSATCSPACCLCHLYHGS